MWCRNAPWGMMIVAAALAAVVGVPTVSNAADRTVPATQAAPDLSTARSAALAWIDAVWAGDAAAAHHVLVADEEQRTCVAGVIEFNAALRAMESAAVEHFGEVGRHVTGYPDVSAKAMASKLEIKEEGDHATATLGEDAMIPLHLRRIDGEWHVDLAETMRDPRMRRAATASRAATKAAQDVAVEIADGKFKRMEDAKAAFHERRQAHAPLKVELGDVRLYLPEATLRARIGDADDAMAQYLVSLQLEADAFWAASERPETAGLLIAVGVRPDGKSRVWCDAVGGDVSDATLKKFAAALESVKPLKVTGGPIAFAMELGFGEQMPEEFPTMPKAWVEAAKSTKQSVAVPDDLFKLIWRE